MRDRCGRSRQHGRQRRDKAQDEPCTLRDDHGRDGDEIEQQPRDAHPREHAGSDRQDDDLGRDGGENARAHDIPYTHPPVRDETGATHCLEQARQHHNQSERGTKGQPRAHIQHGQRLPHHTQDGDDREEVDRTRR